MIQVLTVIGVAIANIGTTITLFMWSTNRSEDIRKEFSALHRDTHRILEGIQQEMKDFHGRLCAIEERNRK